MKRQSIILIWTCLLYILTSIWSVQHPSASQNIQHLLHQLFFFDFRPRCWTCKSTFSSRRSGVNPLHEISKRIIWFTRFHMKKIDGAFNQFLAMKNTCSSVKCLSRFVKKRLSKKLGSTNNWSCIAESNIKLIWGNHWFYLNNHCMLHSKISSSIFENYNNAKLHFCHTRVMPSV